MLLLWWGPPRVPDGPTCQTWCRTTTNTMFKHSGMVFSMEEHLCIRATKQTCTCSVIVKSRGVRRVTSAPTGAACLACWPKAKCQPGRGGGVYGGVGGGGWEAWSSRSWRPQSHCRPRQSRYHNPKKYNALELCHCKKMYNMLMTPSWLHKFICCRVTFTQVWQQQKQGLYCMVSRDISEHGNATQPTHFVFPPTTGKGCKATCT